MEGEAFFHRAPAEPAEKDGRAENGAAVKADEEVDDEGKHGGDDDAAAAQQRGAALVIISFIILLVRDLFCCLPCLLSSPPGCSCIFAPGLNGLRPGTCGATSPARSPLANPPSPFFSWCLFRPRGG